MALYRQIQVSFWQDSFVLDLTPEEKYFYIYLMTNSKTKQCGIYELPKKVIEMDTGYNRETVEKLLKRFEEYGKIKYSEKNKEIFILNWLKHNWINSIKVIKCIENELSQVKTREFVEEIYGIHTVFKKSDTVCIDSGEEEEEKEEEEKEEEEKEEEEDSCPDSENPDDASKKSVGEREIKNQETIELTNLLIKEILKNNPRAQVPHKDSRTYFNWTHDMDKLLRLGTAGGRKGYSADEVRKIILWCQADSFWKSNILSVAKLREKVITLENQMKTEQEKKIKADSNANQTTNKNRFHNFEQRTSQYTKEELEAKLRSKSLGG